jgi:hypothetical protein
MAVAACFGGPVLNLLMGTGAPVLGASLKHGVLPFKLTHGVVALFLETVGARWFHATVVPTLLQPHCASGRQCCIQHAAPCRSCKGYRRASSPLRLMPSSRVCAGGAVRGAAGPGAHCLRLGAAPARRLAAAGHVPGVPVPVPGRRPALAPLKRITSWADGTACL